MTSTGVTSVISRTAVHSGDIGTHTCTASRGGDSASASIVFNVVGEWLLLHLTVYTYLCAYIAQILELRAFLTNVIDIQSIC